MITKMISEWIDVTDFKLYAKSWLDIFSENVNRHPDKTAVYFNGREISYRELDEISNWYAAKVQQANTDGKFIGLCVRRTPHMLAAMIGIQKAGKAYLPIDAGFPEKRILYMIEDSGTKLVITDNAEFLSLINNNIEVIEIDNAERLSVYEVQQVESDSFAYILYTSGSTGIPKGVVVQHGAFLNFLLSMKDKPGCTNEDIVLALTTISFDISGLELFLPLVAGASIWIADSEAVYDPNGIVKLITESEISIAQTTASVWKLIIESGFKGKKGFKILCGGELFPKDLAGKLFKTGCEVWNMYGPTETTIWSSVFEIRTEPLEAPPIGFPIANTGFHILDDDKCPVQKGEYGNLWISGVGLAYGYWNNKHLTEEVFQDGMYNTGDTVYETADGNIAFIGRTDTQLKIRGMRIEAGEVENALIQHPAIKDAVVLVRTDNSGNEHLVVFYIQGKGAIQPMISDLRKHLLSVVPEYMVPNIYKSIERFPMTLNNKIDRKAFPEILMNENGNDFTHKSKNLDEIITSLWSKVLNHSDFGNNDNFFDVGGHSFLLIQVAKELSEIIGETVSPLVFFENPTVTLLCNALGEPVTELGEEDNKDYHDTNERDINDLSVAIIGMSCAVPGASDVDEFWELLKDGRSGIKDYTDDELRTEGISEEEINNSCYVKRSGYLKESRFFDNEFFGYSPKEARFMDPQHRVMLEHSFKALESAGIDPFKYEGRIGVFTGSSRNKYLMRNLLFSSEKDSWSDFQTMIGNDNDFLASRVSYKLNLRGPSLTIQTACSTSLVAVQMAYQSLLNYQCDAALCGGVSVNVPEKEGYEYSDGTIFSPDGICRAFDKDANGTIFGSGVGVVLLKRLADVLEDGDPIVAVIRGAAINNDGSGKIGYTAPSVKGQAEVISDALELAGVPPENVSYIEAHGTGTKLGDPVEIEGLRQAFKGAEDEGNKCYIGSVKTNIGHLDAAAGVIGLIKTALSLKNKMIPPSINFKEPNPEINIEKTRFEINSVLREWKPLNGKRIAGVSAFGIGGTNAHVVMESYDKERVISEISSKYLLYPVSAKSTESQIRYQKSIIEFVNDKDIGNKIDTAYTLMNGRHDFDCRGFFIQPVDDESSEPVIVNATRPIFTKLEAVMVFPGQGTQYPGMSKALYENNAVYRTNLDRCFLIIDDLTGWDSKKMLFEDEHWRFKTEYTQPLLFSVEYSIGKTLIEYGLKCEIFTGHSLGEFPAACLAGAFSLDDAIKLVINRGRIMAKVEDGAMLAVFSTLADINKIIKTDIDIAGINAENQVVYSGALADIDSLQKKLEDNDIVCKRISEKSAFHSRLMEPIIQEFIESMDDITFKPIENTVISNLTGSFLNPGFVYTAEYWVKHLRNTVKFFEGISSLKEYQDIVFIEAGPGAVLSKLVRAVHQRRDKAIVQTLPSHDSEVDDFEFFLKAVGNIWKSGFFIDFMKINSIVNGRRIMIPDYPFSRTEHWIFPDKVMNKISSETEEIMEHAGHVKPPVETVEDLMKKIWSGILGYDEILAEQNFFNLGGDSLLAAELVKQIHQVFDFKLGIKEIILHPVFWDLVDYVRMNQENKKEEKTLSILFPVNPHGSKPPLFLVAGAHENQYYDTNSNDLRYEEDFMRYFSRILHVLGPEQPLYGFRPRGIFYGEKMHKNVEEMASVYINEMKKVQPEGPYYIGGECVGGIVAYEMTQQLKVAGEDVAHLILMDTPQPSYVRMLREEYYCLKGQVKNIKNIIIKDNSDSQKYIQLKVAVKKMFSNYISLTKKQKEMKYVRDSRRFFVRKLLSYKPKPNDCNSTLIINEEWFECLPAVKWTKGLLSNQNVKIVPGNHSTRLSKYGEITGEIISRVIP